MTADRLNSMLLLGSILVACAVGGVLLRDACSETNDGMLKKFESVDDLKDYLRERDVGRVAIFDHRGWEEGRINGLNPPAPSIAEGSSYDGLMPSAPVDYSTTNLQETGVDEADIVKSDGRWLYLIAGTTLAIVDAYPAERAAIVAQVPIEGQASELFLNHDRLVVFTTVTEERYLTPGSSAAPVPVWRQATHALVYSLADRSKPALIRDLSVTGTYSDSRMIGSDIYLITTEPVSCSGGDPLLPEIRDGEASAVIPEVYYADIPWQSYVYQTASSFDIADDGPVHAETYLTGYGSTLYVSEDNIYIAYPRDTPTIPRPLIGGAAEARAGAEDGIGERTIIHRFAIGNGEIAYAATGEVPGHLLNQFSLDEEQTYLRVATTIDGWTEKGSYRYNSVHVLDRTLGIVGSLEYLAPGERIYAARFIGDRLYLVTFKQIDPLFVIDLSDPSRPGVLGKLKIPGYSDYLHPYDEDHLIGIGRETEENEWGGVSVGGVKIALFDVSDVNNPTLLDKVEIGEAGSDSEALYDHKAFLFDRRMNLLVIPVREVKKVPLQGGPYDSYGLTVWQGAYVFGVTPQTGFALTGTVAHEDRDGPSRYGGSQGTVKRSLYIGEVLYTISDRRIIMSDRTDPERKLNEISLPGADDRRYPPPVYR